MENNFEYKLLGACEYHNRKIYIVETSSKNSPVKLTMSYYKSSGQCEKDGQLWGGQVFPIIGIMGCVETPEMAAIRKALWGKNYSTELMVGWICKSPAWSDEMGRNFWTRDLFETSKWLESQSVEDTHPNVISLFLEFFDELDIGFGLIKKPITHVIKAIKAAK